MVGRVHGGGHAWQGGVHGDTVNERAVCIILECILVQVRFLPVAMA